MQQNVLRISPFGDLAMRFETAMRDDGVAIGPLDRCLGLAECFVRITCHAICSTIDLLSRYLGDVLVIDEVRQTLVDYLHCACGIFCLVLIDCGDSHQFITGPLNLSSRSLNDFDCGYTRHFLS